MTGVVRPWRQLTYEHAAATATTTTAAADDDHSGGADGGVSLYVGITAAFLCASTAIGLTVTDLKLVLAFVGATGSTTVSYILPGGCYVALFRREGGCKWYLALAVLCLGLVIMPLSLALIFV